jgi:16S rRNA (guanine527-N7)-methyltransferase
VTALEELLEGAGVQAGLVAPLARYGMLVLEANRRLSLTGAKTTVELAAHLLDSLTVAPEVHEPYVDVGSGAGFPAIVVAIARGVAVTMLEATAKKAAFLERTLGTLGLTGQVIAERAEIAAHEQRLRERFASGTARAVAPAPAAAELLLPFIAPGGVAILQRGTADRGEGAAFEDAVLMLGACVEHERELEGGRRVVVVRKTSSTPARFPRRPGVPQKRPLCLRNQRSP